nr:ParB/RepB/Spo0J family partition protein [Ectothiorhodospira haloalkaliphila]
MLPVKKSGHESMANLRNKKLGLTKGMGAAISRTMKPDLTNAYFMEIPLDRLRIDPENLRNMRVQPEHLRRDLVEKVPPGQSLGEILHIHNPEDLLVPGVKCDQSNYAELSSLQELATSIASMGVIQSVRAYVHGNEYVLIAGERRYLASLLAGKSTIPAYVFNDPPSNEVIRVMQYMENHHRVDLSVMDDVFAQRTLIMTIAQERGGKLPTGADIAVRLGISKSAAYRALRFAKMPQDVIQGIRDGFLKTQNVIDRITREHDSTQRELMIKLAAETQSEREALSAIERIYDQPAAEVLEAEEVAHNDVSPELEEGVSNIETEEVEEVKDLFSVVDDGQVGGNEQNGPETTEYNEQLDLSESNSKKREFRQDPFSKVSPETAQHLLKRILEIEEFQSFNEVVAREVPELNITDIGAQHANAMRKAWFIFLKAIDNDLKK